MSIKVSKAEKLLNNESGKIKSVDILNEINDRIFSYQTKVTVAGDRIEFRKYSKLIKLNNKRLDRKKEGIRGKNGESTSRGEIDYTSRTNKRRKKEIKNLIRCNSDELKTFITLSLGNNDYKELVENKLTNSL